MTTLYNGIDLTTLRAGADGVPAAPDGLARVGSIGRLTPLKGHAVVIDAAALLVKRGVEARFIIAGAQAREGPTHLDDLGARAERLGIAYGWS